MHEVSFSDEIYTLQIDDDLMKKDVVNMSAQVCNNETIKEEYMFLLLPVRAGYEQLTCKVPLAVIFSVECFTLPQT